MQVWIIGHMPSEGYSGGRYHALMTAKALSHAGCDVTVLTDNSPQMWNELRDIPEPLPVKFKRFTGTKPLRELVRSSGSDVDLVIAIPDGTWGWALGASVEVARITSAQLALLNFETPNWFNSLSVSRKAGWRWWPWWVFSLVADFIVSSTEEGARFAKRYFALSTGALHCSIAPAIHDSVAASLDVGHRDKSIVVIMRVKGGGHKGMGLLKDVLAGVTEDFDTTIVIDQPDHPAIDELAEVLSPRGHLYVLSQVSEREKFKLLGSASVLVYPTSFEGFGYPPIESLAVGTPCVVFDLPVFAEILGDAVTTVRRFNTEEMSMKVSEHLRRPATSDSFKFSQQAVLAMYSVSSYSARLEANILDRLESRRASGLSLTWAAFWLKLMSNQFVKILVQIWGLMRRLRLRLSGSK